MLYVIMLFLLIFFFFFFCLTKKKKKKNKPTTKLFSLIRFNPITWGYSYINNRIMPQLVPFYYVNEVSFAFVILLCLIYVFSKYTLPRFVRLFTTRVYITKL